MNRTIYTWKSISLVEIDVTLPNGRQICHTNINHPGAAVILPINEQGQIVLLRQFRPSLNKWLLEIPAGTMEINEDPLICAQRELEEETGYSATDWTSLGQLTPVAGLCDEIQHLFIAKQLQLSNRLSLDDDEVIEVLYLTVDELEQKIRQNEITDTKTIACLSKAKLCGYI